MNAQPAFLDKPMHEMSAEQWESLCDGCGLCCQVQVECGETGERALSNAACRFLDLCTNQCSDYENRFENVEDCTKVTPQNVGELNWLPHTCGYRLVYQGFDLPKWHHLICGDKEEVHRSGPSMRGELISEDETDFDSDDEMNDGEG